MPKTFHFTEDSYEQTIISLFKDMGYEYHYSPELDADTRRELTDSTIPGALRKAMLAINGADKVAAVDEAIRKIREQFSQPLVSANITLTDWLQNGLDVTFKTAQGSLRSDHIKIIDTDNINNNSFVVANQWTVTNGKSTKRADIVVFINGLPISVVELKSPSREVTNSEEAHQQLQNYMRIVPQLFTACQMLVISDMADTRVGTITAPLDRYLEWKTTDGSYESTAFADFETFFNGIFEKHRVIDIIANFTLTMGGDKKIRILAGYHQYFAVKKALECTKQALQRNDGKIGVFWHTQGSGKSILMIILAKWILENVNNSRVVLLTDRTELDKQIADNFENMGEQVARTRSGKELMQFLTQSKPRLIASLIHKFGNKAETDYKAFITEIKNNPLPVQGNVFVFVDECHRTQSGKLNETMKAILQEATFIGFTGTPLLKKDKQTTMDVFGRYIHTYKFNEAVYDGVVKDLVYEGRDIEQNLSSQERVDAWFEAKTKGLNDFQKSELKKRWGTMQNVLSSRSRMDKIVSDILFDFSVKPRLASEKGNAILVASSIYEACKYYELFQNTNFKNKSAIITSYNPQTKDITTEDTGEYSETDKEYIYKIYENLLANVTPLAGKTKTETYEDHNKDLFIKQPARMKLLIVVSKLLTGFDAPPCSYIYIDKKMQDHTLFQAICRTNRLDTDDKDFGYIVDYMELFGNVTDAIDVYTSELDIENFTKEEVDIQLKDRLLMARQRLENALEELETLCEPVELPKSDLDYIHYFCGNTEIPSDLKSNEYKRVALYKAIVSYIRAYANIKAEMELAGYTEKEIANFEERLTFYLKLRETIRIASGETLDLKAYEADMRHLIDNYIQASESQVISPFEDISLLDLMESDIFTGIEKLPEGIRNNPEAVAEVIENSISSKIVEKHLLDPRYFEKMSQLLDELIEQRKKGVLQYKEYLKKTAELIKKVKAGKNDNVPASIKTIGMRAIYNYLQQDEQLTIACEDAVQYSKKDGFRENIQKQNEIQEAIYKVVKDEDKTVEIYKIVENNKYDY